MKYSNTLSLECPHCKTRCQFLVIAKSNSECTSDGLVHNAYICTHCSGIIVAQWSDLIDAPPLYMSGYYPVAGGWKPRVNLSLIDNDEVREDFKEAIDCYNHGFYNACMIMTRRAIQQEMMIKKIQEGSLYKEIESMEISSNLKGLLHKVKNFGNYGAHPDFSLFDSEGKKIDNKKEFAELSLEFLDRYFSDQYEIETLVKGAPKSEKELTPKG